VSPVLSLEEGRLAVAAAREAITAYTQSRQPRFEFPPSFQRKSGAFVTLHTYPQNQLRGCIGFPEPIFPLGEAILRAGTAACEDPRFPPLQSSELDRVVVEVTVLTPPELITATTPEEIKGSIVIGRDGLIIEKGYYRGLLLPQVPVEWGWDVDEYLVNLCYKAGLPPDAWKQARIYRFQGEIFSETEPYGEVVRRD